MVKLHGDDVDETSIYMSEHTVRLSPAQKFLIEKTKTLEHGIMLSSSDEMQLLASLCIAIGAKKTLDVGVFTGYSSLSIAEVLPENGYVVAMDISDKYLQQLCIPAWKMAGVDSKIKFQLGPAKASLQKLIDSGEAGTFDFAYIDADKTGYPEYYELCLQLVRKNGIIAIDNVLWWGKVLDQNNKEPCTEAIRQLNKQVHTDLRVRPSMLSVGDGLSILVKV